MRRLSGVVIFLYFTAFIWLVFAVFWFFRNSAYRLFYSISGIIYALALSVSAHFLFRKQLWAWWLAVILVGFSILASVFDEMGWIDAVYIIVATGLLIVLLKRRSLILKNNTEFGC